MTPKQITYVRGLLHKNGLDDQKDEVVKQFTEGRTTHLTDMTYKETNALITALTGGNTKDGMIRKMLSMAHEMGWELSSGKVDMMRLNQWCRKYTTVHKDLYYIDEKDLPAVVTTFQKVYMSFLKGL